MSRYGQTDERLLRSLDDLPVEQERSVERVLGANMAKARQTPRQPAPKLERLQQEMRSNHRHWKMLRILARSMG